MFGNKISKWVYRYRSLLVKQFYWILIFLVQRDIKEFALPLQSGPSFDVSWHGGHRRHARAAQSDHGIDVLGTRLGRHINVPHQRDRCHWRVVIREPLEEWTPIHHFWRLRGKL